MLSSFLRAVTRTPTPATVGPATCHTQPQTTRFVKAPRHNFTCPRPSSCMSGRQAESGHRWSHTEALTPSGRRLRCVLLNLSWQATSFSYYPGQKRTNWVRQRDEREMSLSLTWTIISFCIIRNERPEFGPPVLVAEAWSPQTEGMFEEQYPKQGSRAVCPMTVNICSTSAKRYTATETQLEEIYCTFGLLSAKLYPCREQCSQDYC